MTKDTLTIEELEELAVKIGTDIKSLINPNSQIFKKMDIKIHSIDNIQAAHIIIENPRIMTRPLLISDQDYVSGFKEKEYQKLLK